MPLAIDHMHNWHEYFYVHKEKQGLFHHAGSHAGHPMPYDTPCHPLIQTSFKKDLSLTCLVLDLITVQHVQITTDICSTTVSSHL